MTLTIDRVYADDSFIVVAYSLEDLEYAARRSGIDPDDVLSTLELYDSENPPSAEEANEPYSEVDYMGSYTPSLLAQSGDRSNDRSQSVNTSVFSAVNTLDPGEHTSTAVVKSSGSPINPKPSDRIDNEGVKTYDFSTTTTSFTVPVRKAEVIDVD